MKRLAILLLALTCSGCIFDDLNQYAGYDNSRRARYDPNYNGAHDHHHHHKDTH